MATRAARGFMDALQEAYGEGREDWSRAYRAGRTANNQSEDAPRLTEMTGAYPTGIRIMAVSYTHLTLPTIYSV